MTDCKHLDEDDIPYFTYIKEEESYRIEGICGECVIKGVKYCMFCGEKLT